MTGWGAHGRLKHRQMLKHRLSSEHRQDRHRLKHRGAPEAGRPRPEHTSFAVAPLAGVERASGLSNARWLRACGPGQPVMTKKSSAEILDPVVVPCRAAECRWTTISRLVCLFVPQLLLCSLFSRSVSAHCIVSYHFFMFAFCYM
jgi:hypothetical protein